MHTEEIPFEEILYIWKKYLWPNRVSEIKPISSMQYLGGYDMSIYEKYAATHWAIKDNDNIVGVNSGFRTKDDLYCSRGLWVSPAYRLKGLSQLLLSETENQAKKEGCTQIWTIPRQSSLPAYLKFGFVKTSEWFSEGVEFGPNCYALKDI